jgi:hypothetical protein
MKHLQLKDCAVLIGLNSSGDCVYSQAISLHEYWDGSHVWDSGKQVKRLKLQKLFGFLFGSKGNLVQQFESTFDLNTGVYSGGWTRHEDGTLQKDVPRRTGSTRSRAKMRAPRKSRR